MVLVTIQRGKKHFRALSSEKILKQEKSQFDLARQLAPKLIKSKRQERQEVIVYEGLSGFQNAHIDAIEEMEKNQNIYVFIAKNQQWETLMGKTLKKFDELRIKKKLTNTMIGIEATEKDRATKKRSLIKWSDTFSSTICCD